MKILIIVAQGGGTERRIGRDFEDRDGDGRTEQTEDQRHGGRRGQSPRIVKSQQDDVGEHDAQVEHHHFVEREKLGVEHAAAGHFHHAARRHDTDDDSHRRHQQDGAHRGGFGAECRVEKVDCVVGNADEKTGDGKDAQDADNDGVDFAHVEVRVQFLNKCKPFFGTFASFASLLTLI